MTKGIEARSTTQESTASRMRSPSMAAELRSLVPNRPLRFAEACRVAELQANRLLKLTGSNSAPTCETVITELPRVEVRRAGSLTGSGATAWSRGKWRIRLNAGEPFTRQRFTLAHEFKHVLDAACEDVIYRHLPDGPGRDRHVEAVCDHFAACLLMPKRLIRQAWYRGTQDLAALAWLFEVSQQAMLIRLQYLGLVEPVPRHTQAHRLGSIAVRGSRRHAGYHRRAARPRYERSDRTRRLVPLQVEGAMA